MYVDDKRINKNVKYNCGYANLLVYTYSIVRVYVVHPALNMCVYDVLRVSPCIHTASCSMYGMCIHLSIVVAIHVSIQQTNSKNT